MDRGRPTRRSGRRDQRNERGSEDHRGSASVRDCSNRRDRPPSKRLRGSTQNRAKAQPKGKTGATRGSTRSCRRCSAKTDVFQSKFTLPTAK